MSKLRNESKVIFQNSNGDFLSEFGQPGSFGLINCHSYSSTRYINVILGNNGIAQRMINGIYENCNKRLPELYSRKEECCGCSACYAVCPKSGKNASDFVRKDDRAVPLLYRFDFSNHVTVFHEHTGAISMLPDEEGFLYPVVDAQICNRCYKCMEVCAFK